MVRIIMLFPIFSLFFFSTGLASEIPEKKNTNKKAVIELNDFQRDNQQEMTNFDVILLMDSSGSMRKTDPQGYRKPAAKLFISLLGESDRIGIIRFGDSAKVLIPLTQNTRENRKDLFSSINKISAKEFSTNITGAVQKGFTELKFSQRKNRIIILMSDGKLTLGSKEKDNSAHEELFNLLPELKKSGIKIYSIAFTELADMKLLNDLAKKTEGFSNLARNDKDIHIIFTSIFEKMKSPDILPLEGNTFTIDKDINEAILLITKKLGTYSMIIDPSDKKYISKKCAKNMQWYESKVFDMITIKDPIVGKWKVKLSTKEGNRVFVMTNLKLKSSFDKNFVNKGEKIKFDIWLERDGIVVREREILEQVSFDAEVVTPDGKGIKLNLIDNGKSGDVGAGDGIYSAEVIPESIGDYSVQIDASGKTFKRERIFQFKVIASPPVTEIDQKMTQKSIIQVIPEKEGILWGVVLIKVGIINLTVLLSVLFLYHIRKLIFGRKNK